MEIKNILMATSYLEFINEIDGLVYELLYSPNGGYTLLTSKDAVDEAQKVLEKFEIEAMKIAKKSDFENSNEIIKDKKTELVNQIRKHCQKEAIVWADSVYQEMIENCLLCVSINKDNKENVDKLYNRALCAISWIKDVKSLTEQEQNSMVENFNNKFFDTLYSKDEENLLNKNAPKSNPEFYLQLRDLILDSEEDFLNTDLNMFSSELSKEDFAFFTKVKNEMATFKKTSIKDEMILINSALSILNLQNEAEKYDFIKQIDNDFILFVSQNKKVLDEENKIDLVKRRIALFKDKYNREAKYYKKMLTASSNE